MRTRLPLLLLFALVLVGVSTARADTTASPCVGGLAAGFPCLNVDLVGHLSLAELGASDDTIRGNDHWGWADPVTDRRYVLFGLSDGTSFVDITDPASPLVLGFLPGREGVSQWRDIKVYQDTAYIVADVPLTAHGLQVFDLTQLRTVASPPEIFSESAHYAGFGPGHNIWVDEGSGYLYAFRTDTCSAATHVVDVGDPLNPTFAGCVGVGDAPLSDAECLVYTGPDPDYQGRELCFTGSDDNVSIDDVSDKGAPSPVARLTYPGIARAHQGSLTSDQRYWLMSDTMDEFTFGHNTRTHVLDLLDVDNPLYLGHYEHTSTARDHNVYIVGQRAYQTNWRSGLRILSIGSLPALNFELLGFFDTAPESDSIASAGSWSNYPWWPDDIISVSDTDNGLFLLRYRPEEPTDVGLSGFDGIPGSPPTLLLAGFLALALAAGRWHQARRRAGRKAPRARS